MEITGKELVHEGKYVSFYHYAFLNKRTGTKGVRFSLPISPGRNGRLSTAPTLPRLYTAPRSSP